MSSNSDSSLQHYDDHSDDNKIKDEEALYSAKEKVVPVSPTPSISSIGGSGSSISSSSNDKSNTSFRILLLTLLVFQASFALVVGRYTRTAVSTEDLYAIPHLVLVIEVTKFVLSNILEHIGTDGQLLESLREQILERPASDSLKVLVPAVLYVIQNSLVYIGLSNLEAPVFISLQQGKIITTAFVSVIMLKRSYNLRQWMCLVTLAVGVAIVALGEQNNKNGVVEEVVEAIDGMSLVEEGPSSSELLRSVDVYIEDEVDQAFVVGFLAVMGGCFSSAFAGVYFEKVLAPEKAVPTSNEKTSSTPRPTTAIAAPPSLWMRNIQLSFFCIIFAYLQGLSDQRTASKVVGSMDFMANDNGDAIIKPYLHGFTSWVWLLVLLQACGGLLCAAVMKYADNVMKGLATGISVVVASVLSVLLLETELSSHFPMGAAVIFASVFFFANRLPSFRCCLAIGEGLDTSTTELVPLQEPR